MTDMANLVIAVDSRSVRGANADLDNLASRGEKAERSIMKMVSAVGGIYAIGRSLQSVVQDAMAFEHAMGTVATVIDDRGKIPELTSRIRALSVEMGQMPTDSAKAMYDIVSAGATDASKAMDILTVSNKLAVGGATEVGVAADGLTSIMAVYSDQVRNATEVADKMFVSAAVGKTTIAELSHHIGMVAPIANTAGVSLGELLGAVGALTKGGLNTPTAVTGIRSFLAQIIKHSDEASLTAKRLGFDYSVTALKAKGLVGFVEDLKSKTGGDAAVMGKIVSDIEGLNAALSLTGPMSKDFRGAVDAMGSSAGKTADAFGVMADTSQFKMDQLKAKIANASIEVGNALIGMVPLSGLVSSFDAIASGALGLSKAMAILLAMRGAEWAAQWVTNLKMKIDVMIAARGHSIAMAQADATEAAAALVSAKAQLTKSQSMVVASGNTFALSATEKMLTAQEAVVTGATNAHAAAMARLKTEQSLTIGVTGGLKSVMSALGGPIGIATAAIMLGAWAWSSWADQAGKAREEAQKVAMAKGEAATSAATLAASLRGEADSLAKAKSGSSDAAEATKKIAAVENDIIALGPQYRELMKDKTKSAKELADQLERVARADVGTVQTQIDALEKRKRAVVGMNDLIANRRGVWSTIDQDGSGRTRTRGSLKAEYDEIEKSLTDLYSKRGAYLNAATPAKVDIKTTTKAPSLPGVYTEREYDKLNESLQKQLFTMKEGEDVAFAYELQIKKNKDGTCAFTLAQQDNLLKTKEQIQAEQDAQKLRNAIWETEQGNYRKAMDLINQYSQAKNEFMFAELDAAQKNEDENNKINASLTMQAQLYSAGSISQRQYTDRVMELNKQLHIETSIFGDLRDTIQDWSKSSTDAFVEFCFTGKNSFSDLINSMLKDLARLAVQKQVMDPLFGYISTGINAWLGGSVAPSGGAAAPTSYTDYNTNPTFSAASYRSTPSASVSIGAIHINSATGTATTEGESAGALGAMVASAARDAALSVIIEQKRPGGHLEAVGAH